MDAEVIRHRRELQALAGEWNELLSDSAADSIFLTWEWVSTWLDAVRPEAELRIAVARGENGRLEAVAPFYVDRLVFVGVVSYRCLRVIGDADSAADYPDVIARKGDEAAGLAALGRALWDRGQGWDCAWFPNVAGWTGAINRFRTLFPRERFLQRERECDFALTPLADTHERFLSQLGHKRRAYLRRQTRRLLEDGRADFVVCRTEPEIQGMLDRLFELNRLRWQSAGQEGAFDRSPSLARFCRHFAPTGHDRGWLRLYALRVDGEIKAVQLGYAYANVFYAIQEGFDPGVDGVGNVLRNLAFEHCLSNGLKAYDFLGGYSEHKRLWRAQRRVGSDLFLGPRRLRTALLFCRPVWPTGRYLRPAGRPSDSKGPAGEPGRYPDSVPA
ncbi:MAG: hypothetical protein AMXMBFR83_07870 [Phycisphaerae bacterium]